MRIVIEIALWIFGIGAFFCIGMSLGTFAEFFKSMSYGVGDVREPLGVGLALLFVCVRLWTLDRRAATKTAAAD